MKLTKDLFNGCLPLLLIEKVQILPTDVAASKQRVDITLSIQKRADAKILPYRIFTACSTNLAPIQKMLNNALIAKDFIRTPTRGQKIVQKEYLKLLAKEDDFDEPGVAADNSRIVKKSLTFTKDFDSDKVNNLYLYAVAYAIDPKSDSESGIDGTIASMLIGKPAVETIISSGKAPNESVVYKLDADAAGRGKKGDIWVGPTNVIDGDVVVGTETPGEAPVSLVPIRVSNQKMQDMRFLNAAENLPFNSTTNGSRKSRKDAEVIKKIFKTSGAISDAHYSRTRKSLNILFTIDRITLARQNTKLGYLILNNTSLGSCLKIENIRVYRTRIEPNVKANELTPGKTSVCGSNTRISTDKLVATLRDGAVKVTDLGIGNGPAMSLIITDGSISSDNIGTHEYTIFLEMIDYSTSAMAEISNTLTILLSRYSKFVDNIEIGGRSAKGANFKTYLKAKKTSIKGESKDWQRLIDYYLTAVRFIFGSQPFSRYSQITWRKNLLAMVNPDNGDMKSILKVREIITNFNTNLIRMYKGSAMGGAEDNFKVTSKGGRAASGKRKIVLEHTFSSKYVKNSSDEEGMDYLDMSLSKPNAGNFTNMPLSGFDRRIAAEVEKYDVGDPDSVGINKYGYLSPKRVHVKGNVVETDTKYFPQEFGNGILKSNIGPGKIGLHSPSSISDKVYTSEMDSLLNYSDVSIIPLKRSIGKLLEIPRVKTVKTDLDSTSYFSNNSPFNKDIEDKKTAISGSSELNIKTDRSREKEILKSDVAKTMTNSLSVGFKRSKVVIDDADTAPSLAAQALKADSGLVIENNNFENAMNYNSIAKIQYFDGFKSQNGKVNINEPRWKTLNKGQIDKLKSNGDRVLCRTVLVNNMVDIPNKYTLPEYNCLFVLGDKPPATKNINPPTYKALLKTSLGSAKRQAKNVVSNIENGAATAIDVSYAISPLPGRSVAPPPGGVTKGGRGGSTPTGGGSVPGGTGVPGGGSMPSGGGADY